MKKTFAVLLFVALWAPSLQVDAVELIPVSEATPGRTGVCVTEMGGGERVEIPVTVLGTLSGNAPEGEIVLVRLDDPRFEHTGIIAGMSGSPVYLDGRLLGALAFGWAFSKEPIGGVTPAERMMDIPVDPPNGGGERSVRPGLNALLEAAAEGSLGTMVLDWLLGPASGSLSHLPLAVTVSGLALPPEGGWLSESWNRLGWRATPGGSGRAESDDGAISPGAMVAGVMVDGDAVLAGAGTVTEVRGDRLWAFGHPSLGAGGTLMPMARAHVVAVLPSLMSSFKFFSVGEPVGAIVADRSHGIVGEMGREAPMVPVRVAVGDESYDFRAVDHPVLLPLLAAYLSQSSQGVRGRTLGDQTVRTSIELSYPELDPVVVESTFAGASASAEAAGFAAAVLAYLENSPFRGPDIEAVDIRIDREEEIRAATILEIVPDRRVVHPGDDLDVRFRIKPHRGTEFTRTLRLSIPEGLPPGRIDLVGADGAAWAAYDLQMRPLVPANFADEVRLLNSLRSSASLVAVLERADVGIAVAGGSLSAPAGVVLQLQSALGRNLETVSYGVVAEAETELAMPVAGAERIQLTVRERAH
jgi:hypothetical protein